ncbi:sn-glycerol-3-phosphate import ATP-binding protein UgpC [Cupriavidus campinensis]|uniref:ABC transporter ATP-binding protein n=1 Tax=Cupriavidus campinensis TaxID=151783 RepID=A0AAE9I383_9BURK|nr:MULTISPECIES: ABC transporter ATP-binding protein [Cupriavidus]TSP10097.1 ABC transporter ATP-binding protein [Cupriavidus campinensis]URF03066.1 ABC transporter ATP-binding protein [Cupriavidus campinensis]CAG2156100.1 sn-glycerol-3-phosphate import ATP-binding protein UgpC [Cupriavidus campinensis]
MQLSLDGVAQQVGSQAYLYPMSLAPVRGAVTILLGATQAGKTSLMRVMAGLDKPSAGRVLADGADVTGVPVRERNVSMVYQQFINYPSLTVFDNIASPLRLRNVRGPALDTQVRAIAGRLRIDHLLARYPAELSGGQQQRVALARALAKNAPLMLLDEPLVNLDYKLREELREELTQLFAHGDATVIYATTEPAEALLLGGYTAVLDAGELLQYGPTPEVFHYPASLRVARAFSDPPMNLVAGRLEAGRVTLAGNIVIPLPEVQAPDGPVTVGVRAAALRLAAVPGAVAVPGKVALAELSGSDTFVHLDTAMGNLVAQFAGVLDLQLGAPLSLHLEPAHLYLFDAAGLRIHAPQRPGALADVVSTPISETGG